MRRAAVAAAALAAGAYLYACEGLAAFSDPLQRFDEGIQLASVSFLAHGVVPLRDVYVPYGPGLALPGLPAEWLLGPDGLAQRLTYAAAPAVAVVLLVVWAARRAGLAAAVCAGAIGTLAHVARYSLPAIAVLAGFLAVDRAVRRHGAGSLAEALQRRPRAVAAAAVWFGVSAWFRPEYVVVSIFLGVVLLAYTRPRRALAAVAAPLVVAVAPYVWIAADGGATSLARWWWYTLFGFRRYRGQPVDWGAPFRFVGHELSGVSDPRGALVWLSFVAGSLVVLVWLVNLFLPRRLRYLVPDPSGLAPLTALVCAYVTYAQSVRFSPENGAAVIVLVWAAVVALRPRRPVVVPLACALGLVVSLPALPRLDLALHAFHTARAAEKGLPPVPHLHDLPLNPDERASFPALLDLWHRYGRGEKVFVLDIRNDDAEGNEPIVYWYLDAKPAAWPASYDPGLTDRSDVEHDTVASLCRTHGLIVQHVDSYAPFDSPRHGSRYLDEFVALDYRVVGTTRLWRLLKPRSSRCLLPQAVSSATVRARRDRLVRAGDTAAAGALSVLLADRARAAGKPPRPRDVALARAGGYAEA